MKRRRQTEATNHLLKQRSPNFSDPAPCIIPVSSRERERKRETLSSQKASYLLVQTFFFFIVVESLHISISLLLSLSLTITWAAVPGSQRVQREQRDVQTNFKEKSCFSFAKMLCSKKKAQKDVVWSLFFSDQNAGVGKMNKIGFKNQEFVCTLYPVKLPTETRAF